MGGNGEREGGWREKLSLDYVEWNRYTLCFGLVYSLQNGLYASWEGHTFLGPRQCTGMAIWLFSNSPRVLGNASVEKQSSPFRLL